MVGHRHMETVEDIETTNILAYKSKII